MKRFRQQEREGGVEKRPARKCVGRCLEAAWTTKVLDDELVGKNDAAKADKDNNEGSEVRLAFLIWRWGGTRLFCASFYVSSLETLKPVNSVFKLGRKMLQEKGSVLVGSRKVGNAPLRSVAL